MITDLEKNEIRRIIKELESIFNPIEDQLEHDEDEDTPDDEKLPDNELETLRLESESLETAISALEELLS
jgi:hypothetical protein